MRVVLALLVLTGVARADPDEKGGGGQSLTGWYAKAGPLLGAAFVRDRGTGFVGGIVGTIVHFNETSGNWYGIQGDIAADTNGEADTGPRYSIGPEIGQTLIGASAGYFGENVDKARHGVYGMVKLTTGFVAVYLRISQVLSSDEDPTSVEVGAQLKLPLYGFSQ